ncbi:50S ribosomal protein L1 [Candidatus Woesearchaeota archaeon]|nr:50S ribosomal protein L1 [Candidatus Woesearchaeota archaeon]
MDKALVAKTLKTVKETSPKRNFMQSIDLIINLKDIDIKKQEQQLNTFVALHHSGKKVSVCALVGPELEKQAKEVCDEVILAESFARYKDKKELKKLANRHDFFIAQANIMPQIATAFGRVFGPRGKMPNPKIGGVLPPNANLRPLYEKLVKTVKIAAKNEPCIKCMVGKENSNEDEIIDNILTIYNSVIHILPNEKHNVKNVMLKLTMGPAFVVGEETRQQEAETKGKKGKPKKKEGKKPGTKEVPGRSPVPTALEKPKQESKPEEASENKAKEKAQKPKKSKEPKKEIGE